MSLDILIAGKYRLGRKLGGGSFGEIFLGTNLQTGEEVGIKLVRWGVVAGCGRAALCSGSAMHAYMRGSEWSKSSECKQPRLS